MDWQTVYLRALGVAPTAQARARLGQWQQFEGGATGNNARFNYLNTTLPMPGSSGINSVGVQSYRTLGQGALAFSKTLRGRGDYAPLVEWLRSGQGDPSAALQVWVSGQPGGNPSYAAKVLGGKVPAPPAAALNTPSFDTPAPSINGSLDTPEPSVQKTAADGFAAIAQGKADPSETFDPLISSIKANRLQPTGAVGGTTPVVDIPGSSPLEQQAAALVHKYLGVKYTWGGTSPQGGFDCSGLVQYAYRALGVNIPRTTYAQWDAGKPVDPQNLKPGDGVFFTGSDPQDGKPGHEGMYIGDGKFIEAPHSGATVRVSSLAGRSDFVGARRFSA